MTFGELQVMVSDWLDDPNNGYFTLDQIKRWLNNAQRECQKQLLQAAQNYYYITVYTQITADSNGIYQSQFELPADFLKMQKAEYVKSLGLSSESSITLLYTTPMQADQYPNNADTTVAYYFKKTRMVVTPIPQYPDYIRISYAYAVADMVLDSEVPDCPINYHEYLAVLATIDGLCKDQRDPSTWLAKKEYYEKLMKADEIERNQDFPRSVRGTWSDDDTGFLF